MLFCVVIVHYLACNDWREFLRELSHFKIFNVGLPVRTVPVKPTETWSIANRGTKCVNNAPAIAGIGKCALTGLAALVLAQCIDVLRNVDVHEIRRLRDRVAVLDRGVNRASNRPGQRLNHAKHRARRRFLSRRRGCARLLLRTLCPLLQTWPELLCLRIVNNKLNRAAHVHKQTAGSFERKRRAHLLGIKTNHHRLNSKPTSLGVHRKLVCQCARH